MTRRKVTYVRLHTIMHLPNLGQMDPVFPQSGGKTLDKLEMYTEEAGVSISFKRNGLNVNLFVPYGNVVGMLLAPEEQEAPKKPAKSA